MGGMVGVRVRAAPGTRPRRGHRQTATRADRAPKAHQVTFRPTPRLPWSDEWGFADPSRGGQRRICQKMSYVLANW